MQISCLGLDELRGREKEALVLAIREDEKNLHSCQGLIDSRLVEKIAQYLFRKGFTLKKGDVFSFETEESLLQRVYVGILSKEPSLEETRQLVGRVLDQVSAQKQSHVWIFVDPFCNGTIPSLELAEAISEVVWLASYRFDKFKPPKDSKTVLKSCALLFRSKKDFSKIRSAIKMARDVADSVNFARDLVNTPANELPPRILADRTMQMAKECGIRCQVFGKKELQKMKMGGILAVSQGSVEEPRLVVLEYGKRKAQADFVFVGKGVTFDSGGISIKPSDGMEKMKYDMAGAAAVAGVLRAVAKLGLDGYIVGIMPAVENMPSGTAIRPGDVVWMGSGKSVEILNTDAEGRVILGDALYYAQKFKPKAVVDLATLTGACVVALGSHAVGLLGNDHDLIRRIKSSGDQTGERAWELPLWDDYFEQIKSDVAEIKNVGSKGGGTITAAMFLKQFVDYPWAHLDIAGTAWTDDKKSYLCKGATGVGVRLLTRMLRDWKKP